MYVRVVDPPTGWKRWLFRMPLFEITDGLGAMLIVAVGWPNTVCMLTAGIVLALTVIARIVELRARKDAAKVLRGPRAAREWAQGHAEARRESTRREQIAAGRRAARRGGALYTVTDMTNASSGFVLVLVGVTAVLFYVPVLVMGGSAALVGGIAYVVMFAARALIMQLRLSRKFDSANELSRWAQGLR
jgi:hypothetical protein